MVFYIVACQKDGTTEDVQKQMVAAALRDNNRSMGDFFHLSKEQVSA
jgi:hypothetical protein